MIWVSIIYDRKLFIVVYYVFLDLSGGFLVPFMTRPRLVMTGARNSTLAQSAGSLLLQHLELCFMH